MEATFFTKQSEWREWLEKNHDKTHELWVGFYKKDSGIASITWPEAVDEALCVGWIDGIRKSIDKVSYAIRFTPRKPKSIWSAVNLKRIEELTKLDLMQPRGLEVFNKRDEKKANQYSFEQETVKFDDTFEAKFKENKKAWNFFQSQAPYYQKTAIWWVISAKQIETRLKRLATLIKNSEEGQKIESLRRTSKSK